MKFRFLVIYGSIPVLLCQCASEHRVIGAAASQSSLSGSGALTDYQKETQIKDHFAGWKPDEANWYSASGETDKKKIKENEENRRRSSFESKVDKTRDDKKAFTKSSVWEDRKAYTKDWAGAKDKEKKTFAWPWQNKEAKTKESDISKDYMARNKVGRESDIVARETGASNKEGSREFDTKIYDPGEPKFKSTSNISQKKVDSPEAPVIIEDRAKAEDRDGWSVSDIRKFLNKS